MISFFNIKTGERVQLTRPHQIGAYLNSSDLSVNAQFGQDFGWRLAPEVIIKLDEFRADPNVLQQVATRIGVDISELTTIHLVQHISYLDDMGQKIEAQRKERTPEFQADYEQEIARRRKEFEREWNDAEPEHTEAPVVEEPVATENPVDEDLAAAAPKGEPEVTIDSEPASTKPVQTDLEEEVKKKTATTPNKK